jgi:hypothetical protein
MPMGPMQMGPRPMGMGMGLGKIGGGLLRGVGMDMFNPMKPSLGSVVGMGLGTLAGIAMTTCPMALLTAGSSFLMSGFSNPFQTLLAMELMNNTNAMQQLMGQINGQGANQQTVQAAPVQQQSEVQNQAPVAEAEEVQTPAQPEAVQEEQEANVTNPIENKQPSPLDRAQTKYAKAMDKQQAAQDEVSNKRAAQRTAKANLDAAKAALAEIQAQYDAEEKPELKTQMTSKLMNAQQTVTLKEAAYNTAKTATAASRASLNEINIKVEQAQRNFENLRAEEMVDVD